MLGLATAEFNIYVCLVVDQSSTVLAMYNADTE